MAQMILPHLCPLCNSPVDVDQPRRIVGFDLSRWPDQPPLNLWGHRSCAAGREELILIPPIGPIMSKHDDALAMLRQAHRRNLVTYVEALETAL